MKGAQVMFTLAAFLKIALILYPAREQAYIFFGWSRDFKVHFSLSVLVAITSFGVPCIYPRVTSLLGITGGLLTGTLGYSVPLCLKLLSLGKSRWLTFSGISHWLLFIIVVGIQVVGTYVSITSDS